MKTTFGEMSVGDVFVYGECEFVKVRTNTEHEQGRSLSARKPNCLCIETTHYCVFGDNLEVEVVKTLNKYPHKKVYSDRSYRSRHKMC